MKFGYIPTSLQATRLRMLDPILCMGKTPQASKTEIQLLLCSIIRAILFHFNVEGQAKTGLTREQTVYILRWKHTEYFLMPRPPPCSKHYLSGSRYRAWLPRDLQTLQPRPATCRTVRNGLGKLTSLRKELQSGPFLMDSGLLKMSPLPNRSWSSWAKAVFAMVFQP